MTQTRSSNHPIRIRDRKIADLTRRLSEVSNACDKWQSEVKLRDQRIESLANEALVLQDHATEARIKYDNAIAYMMTSTLWIAFRFFLKVMGLASAIWMLVFIYVDVIGGSVEWAVHIK